MSSLKYALACTGASIQSREVYHTSICDGDCDGGSGEAEVVEPMSGEGVHSTYDVIPLGDGRGTVSLMRRVGWTRRQRALVGRSHDGWKRMVI